MYAEDADGFSTSSANDEQLVFVNSFKVQNGSTESLTYDTTISDESVARTCKGHVNATRCWLVSAIGEYNVEVLNGVVTLTEPHSYPRIIARANNTALTSKKIDDNHLKSTLIYDSVNSTLAGIAMSGNLGFIVRQGLVTFPGTPGWTPKPQLAPALTQYALQHISNYAGLIQEPENYCAPAWKDPRDSVMAKLVR